ncbi:MAG TPA: serine/threonine-protein kinase [Gemmataceae bacterium]|nr:serine/threonine-protein kinase [Gemmataceae bacterium]
MEPTQSLERHLLGQTLAGKYKLLDVQASGFFGAVFRGEQYFGRQRVRSVAVKVSRQTELTEDTAPYLFGDALILAQLLAAPSSRLYDAGRHHLVQIHDMGLLPEHDNRAFLVMEYVDGLPLLSHMRAARRLSVSMGLRFLKQICRGMALVHSQGAVHRDLKSDNILVDRRGVIRILDFGLAAYADPRLGFAPGSIGNFIYMAPETLLGRSTPASDVYSLGLLMYELFAGGGPHLTAPWPNADQSNRGDECLRLKKAFYFPPPSAVQNEIRNDYRWLDALILRCLEVEPERRFADAGRLLAAIDSCEAGQPLPPSSGEWRVASGENPVDSPLAARYSPLDEVDALFREVRRLLAAQAYERAIDRLDVHRPPEWAVLDALGAWTLRLLGQAYLRLGNPAAASDCLEQLRTAQKEQSLLPNGDYAAALSDLFKCYYRLGQMDAARACQEEARQLL